MGGRLTEPVATCPHCMLRFHEKCARRILIHRMRMVAAATAMQGDGGAGALPDPLSVPELQSAVLEMRPFGRNVVCALCRQGCARIGASGSRNARSSSLGGTKAPSRRCIYFTNRAHDATPLRVTAIEAVRRVIWQSSDQSPGTQWHWVPGALGPNAHVLGSAIF